MSSSLIWLNFPGFRVKAIRVLHRIHHSWQFGCHTFMLAFIIFILKQKEWRILSFIAPTAGFSGAMCVWAAQVWSPGCVMVWMGLQRADSVTNYIISLNAVNSTFIYLRNLIFSFKNKLFVFVLFDLQTWLDLIWFLHRKMFGFSLHNEINYLIHLAEHDSYLLTIWGFSYTFVSEPHMRREKQIQQWLQLRKPRMRVAWREALPNSSPRHSSAQETVRNPKHPYKKTEREGFCSFYCLFPIKKKCLTWKHQLSSCGIYGFSLKHDFTSMSFSNI